MREQACLTNIPMVFTHRIHYNLLENKVMLWFTFNHFIHFNCLINMKKRPDFVVEKNFVSINNMGFSVSFEQYLIKEREL